MIYTTHEAADRLCVTAHAIRLAWRSGLLDLRRIRPEERSALIAAGRLSDRCSLRAVVVEQDELERYQAERRSCGRPRKNV